MAAARTTPEFEAVLRRYYDPLIMEPEHEFHWRVSRLAADNKHLDERIKTWDFSHLMTAKPTCDPSQVFAFLDEHWCIHAVHSREELPADVFMAEEEPYRSDKRMVVTFQQLGVSANMMNTFLHATTGHDELRKEHAKCQAALVEQLKDLELLELSLEADDDPCDERIYRWHQKPEHYLELFQKNVDALEAKMRLLEKYMDSLEAQILLLGKHFSRRMHLMEAFLEHTFTPAEEKRAKKLAKKHTTAVKKEAKLVYALEAVKQHLLRLKAA
jgi:hypothetical protein